MSEDDFRRLIDAYLVPPADSNPEMSDVELVWIVDNPDVGALHMAEKHQVTQDEVEDVLLFMPPAVKARRSPDHPERTLFWGATRSDRWLLVVCEDVREGPIRKLTPITAFEPDDGEAYWRRYGRK